MVYQMGVTDMVNEEKIVRLHITESELKEYRSVISCFKAIGLRQYVQTYIFMWVFVLVAAATMYFFAPAALSFIVFTCSPYITISTFIAIYLFALYLHGRDEIVKELHDKYFDVKSEDEILEEDFRLKKVQISDGELRFIYHRAI